MTVIDAHAHLDQRMLDVPSIVTKMDAAGVDKVVLIPCMNDPLPETPRALLACFRGLMCSPFHDAARWLNERFYDSDGNLVLRGETYEIYERPDNATVAQAIADHPDRFLGWIFLNPRLPEDQVEELERWRQTPGFVGVKLHPHWHDYPLVRALPIAKRCEQLGLPMLIHLGFGTKGEWQRLTSQCPKLKLVFAHAGMPFYNRMWEEVRDNPNLHLDVSSPYLSERLVRWAVHRVGPHRVIYGTDAPYGFHTHDGSYDYRHIKQWVHRLPNRSNEIECMLGTNVEKLLSDQRC